MKHTNVIAITVVIVLSFVLFSFLSVKKSANSDTNSDKAPPTSEVLATLRSARQTPRQSWPQTILAVSTRGV